MLLLGADAAEVQGYVEGGVHPAVGGEDGVVDVAAGHLAVDRVAEELKSE